MSSFGGQSVTFVEITYTGEPGYLGVREPVRTETVVERCRFRPLRVDERAAIGVTDTSTEIWKITAPPVPAVLDAKPNGEVIHDGTGYEIDGPVQPKRDMGGQLHHVTVFCKRQVSHGG